MKKNNVEPSTIVIICMCFVGAALSILVWSALRYQRVWHDCLDDCVQEECADVQGDPPAFAHCESRCDSRCP